MGGEAIKNHESEGLRPAPVEIKPHEIVIESSRGWVSLKLGELWDYRELLYFLAWRDIKIRYKQTALGVLWAVLQPLLTMLIFALFFGRLARMPSDNVPYPIFVFAALVPWTFFANGLTQSSNSLVGSANLIKKVYFPRLVVPVSVVLGGLPDFALSFLLLVGMMAYYGIRPQLAILIWMPLLLLLALVTALGCGLWLSALNVKYRDVRYIVGFLVQIWMFATPVAYPASLLSGRWRLVYSINPMVGVVEGFRRTLLRTEAGAGLGIAAAISATAALLILVTGMFYFRRMEKTFADIV